MRCSELIERLEELAPPHYAEEWDNVGLLTGRRDKEIGKVMVAVDATSDVIEQARRAGADLLLTHHPLLFRAQKRICSDDFIGKRLLRLIQSDICYYAMHTNFDVMGMADAAADELGLKSPGVLKVTCEDEVSHEGIGRYGKLPGVMTLAECAEYVKTTFALPQAAVYGDLDRIVEVMAVLPGSGGDEIPDALRVGADVYLTGDISHHDGIDAMEQGLSVIDAGHFGLEKLFVTYMRDYFFRELPEITLLTAEQEAPFQIV
ncbi:MAG: Nif3-like dinuclear metal center hexameric protein [bacterium]|nr:Nif3-like dinuclear metal center hexameric protein [bacterium]